jgi:branched-chain amino acid transport system permease protein
MAFLIALLVDGALTGALYALVALAFVVVYKASRLINFALGEWIMLAARLVAAGLHALGLGLGIALGFALVGMTAVAIAFNGVVLRRLVGQPLISLIMVTIGLSIFLRGAAAVVFAGVPGRIALPVPRDALDLHGVLVAPEKVVAAAIAVVVIAAVAWFFHASRAGVALRAIADDQQLAMAMGIDLPRYLALTWIIAGGLAVVAGTLWTAAAAGGFGMVLVGLKIFPIVIIGGLDSIPGALVGALLVGVLESLAAGYLDPLVGGGFSTVASYLVLLAVLFVRPHGLFGRVAVERI